eukprot:TRINITY_DN1882_c0_g1_i1.p1 TRINITY_DN1882_c0_g1~~TRINITY_DN1882_c0_g1_i1.p1  ORF type:complete len:319 (+),score=32.53 TRINITY_DN1882_c0_g1_i1:84-1040(+)
MKVMEAIKQFFENSRLRHASTRLTTRSDTSLLELNSDREPSNSSPSSIPPPSRDIIGLDLSTSSALESPKKPSLIRRICATLPTPKKNKLFDTYSLPLTKRSSFQPPQRGVSHEQQQMFQNLADLLVNIHLGPAAASKQVMFVDQSDPNVIIQEFQDTQQFFEELKVADFLDFDQDRLDERFDKSYSFNDKRGELRGGLPYFVPSGWKKYGVKVEDFNSLRGWNMGYHGTTFNERNSILSLGLLLPGRCLGNGKFLVVRLGQRGASRFSPAIYATPSIHYAGLYAHPLYNESDHVYFQIAFQVRCFCLFISLPVSNSY